MSAATRRPYLGEDVHYQSFGTPGHEYSPQCRTAKITEVEREPGKVSLIVFNPTGVFLHQGLKHDEERAGGTWHYAH
jgi:hypothetical protein